MELVMLRITITQSNNRNWLQLFTAAADILHKIGADGRIIQEFVALGAKAKVAATEAMDAEATLGEIPDEFLDPIQVSFRHLFLVDKVLPVTDI